MSLKTITQLCEELVQKNDYFYNTTFQRHLDDIERFKDDNDMRFNDKMAQIYIVVMESMKHFKGSEFAGKHFLMEDWQKAVIGISQGWEKRLKGKNGKKDKWVRRFHTLNILVSRKNGKTFISAGLALADMMIRSEPQGEIVCIATKRDQAKIAWNGIDSMVKSHDDLKGNFSRTGTKLTYQRDGTTITTLGRDSSTEDGANYSFAVVDEYHAHSDAGLFDVTKSSMGARLQPIILIISTAGFNLGSPLVAEVEHARDILNGNVVDDGYFAFIAEPKQGADPFDIDTIRSANPNIGVSVSEEYLIQESLIAKQRPEKLVAYLTKHLNIFVNASEVFIGTEEWKNCVKKPRDGKLRDINEATRMFIGTDLSISDDFTAVVKTYQFEDNYLQVHLKVFIPDSRVDERSKRLKVPLETWIAQDYITLTKGKSINYETVYAYIAECIEEANELDIPVLHGYDPFKAKSIIARLENDLGFDDNLVVRQGFATMTEPLSMLKNYVKEEQMEIVFNPVLNWMASNIQVQYDDYGNMKVSKLNPIRKIDGIAALLNTLAIAIPYIEEQEESVEIFWV